MISETRHLVEMADIRGVEIACKNGDFGSKVVVSSGSSNKAPAACPVVIPLPPSRPARATLTRASIRDRPATSNHVVPADAQDRPGGGCYPGQPLDWTSGLPLAILAPGRERQRGR